jgi:hypothetical protein
MEKTVSESFFTKTAKFTPTLLKSSVGKLHQSSSLQNIQNTKAKVKNTFANALKETISQKENTKTAKSQLDPKFIHKVMSGETLTHIALNSMKRAGLKIDSKEIMQTAYKIAKFNSIKNPNLIIPGQKIDLSIIKSKTQVFAKVNSPSVASNKSASEKNLKSISGSALDENVQNNRITKSKTIESVLKNISAINAENESNKNHNPVLNKTLNRAIDLGYISNTEATKAKENI